METERYMQLIILSLPLFILFQIRDFLLCHFGKHIADELEDKERELLEIEENILHTKVHLYKLRLILLAQEQGYEAFKETKVESLPKLSLVNGFNSSLVQQPYQQTWMEFEEHAKECVSPIHSDNEDYMNSDDESWSVGVASQLVNDNINEIPDNNPVCNLPSSTQEGGCGVMNKDKELDSRFYTKTRVIVGNTSQYLKRSVRMVDNLSTHKWMVYVRSGPTDPAIHSYIRSITFFLHPTYSPHDIIQITKPPFHLTRLGWGEFPVRVQLHFHNSRHKPVDILHNLTLDHTHTGQQMLGAETSVNIELLKCDLSTSVNTTPDKTVDTHSDGSLVYYVKLPVVNQTDVILLDHDYALKVFVTRSDSPPALPLVSPIKKATILTDQVLHVAAKNMPLYGRADLSFAAKDFEEYNKWGVVKQRANEWMRAVSIKKCIHQTGMTSFKNFTTKQILMWCRRHGHTPYLRKYSSCFCGVCGHLMSNEHNCKIDKTCTLSNLFDRICELVDIGDKTEQDGFDVESDLMVSKLVNKPVLYRVPKSPELRWVHETCTNIGVYLHPQSHDRMLLHVVDHMIFSACSQFLCQLLRKAVSIETEYDDKIWLNEHIIIPYHIITAVRDIDIFDFLTNKGMGFESCQLVTHNN